jgi:hypothetical protein
LVKNGGRQNANHKKISYKMKQFKLVLKTEKIREAILQNEGIQM